MHPAIAYFPSRQFYGGRVRSGVTQQDRPPLQVRARGGAAWGVCSAGAGRLALWGPSSCPSEAAAWVLAHDTCPALPVPSRRSCASPSQGVPWSNPSCPVLFINVEGSEQRTAAGKAAQRRQDGRSSSGSGTDDGGGGGGGGSDGAASYCNPAEAEVVLRVVRRLLEEDSSLQSLALLSPYRWAGCWRWGGWAQARAFGRPAHPLCVIEARQALPLMKDHCQALNCLPPSPLPRRPPCSGQVRLLSELLGRAALPPDLAARCSLAVSTVDGYQGREADAVVFSAVRCNPEGRVGFLADERRLNVAITRPRRGLIVVGHQATLAHDPNWAAWMAWVASQRKQRAAGAPAASAAGPPGAASSNAAGGPSAAAGGGASSASVLVPTSCAADLPGQAALVTAGPVTEGPAPIEPTTAAAEEQAPASSNL